MAKSIFVRTFALSAMALCSVSLAHAQGLTDAGQVGVAALPGSYQIIDASGSWGSSVDVDQASVVTQGLLFRPVFPGAGGVGIASQSNSAFNYSDSSLVDMTLRGVFKPEPGRRIDGFRLTVLGSVQAAGSGKAQLHASLSFAEAFATGGNDQTTWQNLGNNLQSFSLIRTYQVNPLLGGSIPWPTASLHLTGNTTSTWNPPFCYEPDLCTDEITGSAALNLTSVRLEALVSVTPEVPEASGLWLALAGGAALVGWRRRLAR